MGKARLLPDRPVKAFCQIGMGLEIGLDGLFALADLFRPIGVPGATLFEKTVLDPQIDELPDRGDPLIEGNVKLRLSERGSHLVLDDLHPHPVAQDMIALLDGLDPANVEALRGIELQGISSGRCFGVAEHDADLHSDLIDEDHYRGALGDGRGELSQSLAHESGLKTHMGVSHVPFKLRLGNQRRHRIDHNQVETPRSNEGLGDLQGLLSGVRLGNEKVFGLDPKLSGIAQVESVLGINKGCHAILFVDFGNGVKGQGGLARGLGTIDFDDPSLGIASDSQGDIQGQGARRNDGGLDDRGILPHSHD